MSEPIAGASGSGTWLPAGGRQPSFEAIPLTNRIVDWSKTQGAKPYRLQVDDDGSFASPVIDQTKTGTSYRPGGPMPPGTYHWRVRGIYDCGNGAWAKAFDLTILPTGLEYEAYLPLVLQEMK